MRDALAFTGTLLLVLAIFAAGIWLNATGLGVPLGVLLLVGVPAWTIAGVIRSGLRRREIERLRRP